MPSSLHALHARMAETLRAFPASARYLVGVSGGCDSVALLHSLGECGYARLIVCHLDHQLRGRASTADARFVQRLAAARGLEFEGAAADVRAFAAQHSLSLETAARAVRYAFFLEVARRRRCRLIFLGHHADDLAETFLFNLLRGTGTAGLASLRAVSVQQLGRTRLTIIRPLLGLGREEIARYVAERALKYREDASNRSLGPTRNRLRHRVIPMIEQELGRGVRQSLWRAAQIAAEEHLLLEEMLPPELRAQDKLSLGALRRLPVALQRRALRAWLREHGIGDVGYDLVEEVRALLQAGASKAKVNLPGDRHARRRAGVLFLE